MLVKLKCSCGQSIDFHNSYFIDNDNIAICEKCYRKEEMKKHTPGDSIKSEIKGTWINKEE